MAETPPREMANDEKHLESLEPPLRIRRSSTVHTKVPYELKELAWNQERISIEGKKKIVEYVVAVVPMDCIDDVTRAHVYNPRHPKEDHRDRLMHQIGTYGLIQPLVGTFDLVPRKGQDEYTIFLVDGRHRFHALLELDEKLHKDIQGRSKRAKEAKQIEVLSDISNLRRPKPLALQSIKTYEPRWENEDPKNHGAALLPIKIYLNQDEVERIGMAVFLNKGQKKLAGGEEIDRIFEALSIAFEEEEEKDKPSERAAVDRVAKGRGADTKLVVLSQHVARIIRDKESPWFDLIGRWQNDTIDEEEENPRRKPLTAKNFMEFTGQLVHDQAYDDFREELRDAEIHNLNELGNIFSKIFDWPNDIPKLEWKDDAPVLEKRYTPTSILCRSFLISTTGIVLNRHAKEGEKLLNERTIPAATWKAVREDLEKLQKELQLQAELRVKFEKKKKELKNEGIQLTERRKKLLFEIDSLRGKLWSMDTIVASLESRILQVLGEKDA